MRATPGDLTFPRQFVLARPADVVEQRGDATARDVEHLEPHRPGGVECETQRHDSRPGARSVGVGEAMADDIVAFCATRRCTGIDAVALPGHRATKNFFEEGGFTARAIVMHRALDRREEG